MISRTLTRRYSSDLSWKTGIEGVWSTRSYGWAEGQNLWRFHPDMEYSLKCFSTILRPKNFYLQKSRITAMLSIFWQIGSDPQTMCAWRNDSKQWILCTRAGRVIKVDFERATTILKERFLSHGSVPACSAKTITWFLVNCYVVEIGHPPYSSDVLQLDCH